MFSGGYLSGEEEETFVRESVNSPELYRYIAENKGKSIYCGITLLENERSVYVDDKKVDLTFKEFELLRLLISKPKTVFHREVILETIWGYEDNLGRTLDIHINTLRKKLGEKGKYIITVRNVGYKIEKEVSTNEA